MKNLYIILSIIFYLSKQTYLCKNFLSTPHPPQAVPLLPLEKAHNPLTPLRYPLEKANEVMQRTEPLAFLREEGAEVRGGRSLRTYRI